jgi:hypothetical protein
MKVEFYTKPRCALCDKARLELLRLLSGRQFDWVEHDITGSAELFEEYRYDIPVVRIDGLEVGRLHLDHDVLRRLLGR